MESGTRLYTKLPYQPIFPLIIPTDWPAGRRDPETKKDFLRAVCKSRFV